MTELPTMKERLELIGEFLHLRIEVDLNLRPGGVFVEVYHRDRETLGNSLVGQFFLKPDEALAFSANLKTAVNFLMGVRECLERNSGAGLEK